LPHNPIANLDIGIPTTIHYMEHSDKSNVNDVMIGYSKNKHNNELVLKYLSELDLIPIKETDKLNSKDYHFNYMLKYDTQVDYNISIDYISSEDLTILHISANQPVLDGNSGYYKIRGDEFEYKYINNLIDDMQK